MSGKSTIRSTTILERLLNPQVEISSILKIDEIGIENLVLVFTYGYQTICEKGKFDIGQEIIFVHNDILVDTRHKIFSSVKEQIKKVDIDKDGWYLVQTILIKGYYSDGIVLSLDTLTRYNLTLETLPIKKYSKPYEQLIANDEMTYTNSHSQLSQSISMEIPEFLNLRPGNFLERIIPKTDEINIKTYIDVFKKIIENDFYCTIKLDGSSMTILYDSVSRKFTICSRNLTLHDPNNEMVKFVIKLIQEQNLVEKFDQLCKDLNCKIICVQGEYCGPKVNGNQMQLTSDDFYMFSVRIVMLDDFDNDEDDVSSLVPCRYKKNGNSQRLYTGYFLDYDQLIDFSQRTGIKMVPILDISLEQSSSFEALTDYTSQLRYTDFCVHMPNFAEGIVIRPKKIVSSEIFPQGFQSVKLLNPNYKIDPTQLAKTTKTKDQIPN